VCSSDNEAAAKGLHVLPYYGESCLLDGSTEIWLVFVSIGMAAGLTLLIYNYHH
jgi:hypothetical protein